MLQREGRGGSLTSYAYLVSVEIEDGVAEPSKVAEAMADALRWIEGVGAVDVDNLGRMDVESDS